mmetsp:Transcript_23314/g.57208  ORF Transcript_23314/g.57208 Transcript_23314/m.57208 type:complete len:661 (-) Transcript_23314:369-2351(-)
MGQKMTPSARAAALWAAALLAAVCLGAAPASARIESRSLMLYAEGGSISEFDLYGFKAGGTARFDVNYRRTDNLLRNGENLQFAYVMGCREKELLQFEVRLQDVCAMQERFKNATFNTSCYVLEIGDKSVTSAVIPILKREILLWGVVMCGSGNAQVDLQYTFMNPGGEHLDTGHSPLPRLFLCLMLVWLFLTTLQGGHAFVWHASTITALHRLMLMVPCVKFFYAAVSMFKWEQMSENGTLADWVTVLHVTAFTLNQAMTFGTLLLIARGWLITRRHLPNGEKQTTVTSITLLVVLNFAYRYYTLSNFSFFALAILYMTILALILSSVARNVRELKMQLMILRQADIDPTSTPAHQKAIMYRRYQLIMFSFVCTKIFLEMVLLFLRDYQWITYLFTEVVDMLLCVAVGYTFRLRDNNPFNTEQGDFNWLPFNPNEVGGGPAAIIARMAELGVQIPIPLPKIYETEIRKAALPGTRGDVLGTATGAGTGTSRVYNNNNEGCVDIPYGGQMVVVVENPPTSGKDGELLENVSMAARLSSAEEGGVAEVLVNIGGAGAVAESRGGAGGTSAATSEAPAGEVEMELLWTFGGPQQQTAGRGRVSDHSLPDEVSNHSLPDLPGTSDIDEDDSAHGAANTSPSSYGVRVDDILRRQAALGAAAIR